MTNHLYDALIAPHRENDAVFLRTDDGHAIQYRDFVARTARIANVLQAAQVQPGARVVVQAPKHPDMLALYAATIQCGAVFLPLNTAYTEAELSYFVTDAAPRVMVCDRTAEQGPGPHCRSDRGRIDDPRPQWNGQPADAGRHRIGQFRYRATRRGRPGSVALYLGHHRSVERRDADP